MNPKELTPDTLLYVDSVKKSFGPVQAIKEVFFTLKRGSIHALCGVNGAGKSTFLSILMGFILPDSGDIYLKGKKVNIQTPSDAIKHGIAIVQQELSAIPDLTVAENIWLGREPGKLGFIDFKELNLKTETLMKYLNFDIPATAKMRDLSVAEQQLVEIAKALSHSDADVLIMDEPTSAIGEEDVQKIFDVIKMLTEKGKGIIYVSHRLSEIFQIADSYTVFRDGTYICDGLIKDVNREQLIQQILGSELKDEFAKFNEPTDKTILKVENVCWEKKVKNISFELKEGEILGIYGLVGAGRSEMLDVIFGIKHGDSGTIEVDGKELPLVHTPAESIKHGIAYVTEDRKETGLVLSSSISDNINISSLKPISSMGFVNETKEEARALDMIKLFNVKTPSSAQIVGNLSGGNQQKVVLGRWALTKPKVLLLDEPTRGIDVGAKKEIYKFMSELAQEGKGIIMVSSELSEIIGMSDRILVFRHGELACVADAKTVTQTSLMKMAV